MTDPKIRFEEALAQLEELAECLEKGQCTLDESLEHFERGVSLLRHCRAILDGAETRIRQFVDLDEHGMARLKDFAHEATAGRANPREAGDRATPREPDASEVATKRRPTPSPREGDENSLF